MQINSPLERKLLHYTGKAIHLFNLIKAGDKILLCLSGGKDSFALVRVIQLLHKRAEISFSYHILMVDNGIPAWNRNELIDWLRVQQLPFTSLSTNIAEVVINKKLPGKSPCVLCSRLRRGYIYTFARTHHYNKIALGHHRDDIIVTLLMSMFYGGKISAMPPKLITRSGDLVVIRPLIFCQEKDLEKYALEQHFPLSPRGICPLQKESSRERIEHLIAKLAVENPKIPSNLLHAAANLVPTHLLDQHFCDFKQLEENFGVEKQYEK